MPQIKHVTLSLRLIAQLLKNMEVRSQQFDRMKFVQFFLSPIVLIPLPDSWADGRAEITSENDKLPPDRPTESAMLDYYRSPLIISFHSMQVLPLAGFTSDFSYNPPIPLSFGQWDHGFRFLHFHG